MTRVAVDTNTYNLLDCAAAALGDEIGAIFVATTRRIVCHFNLAGDFMLTAVSAEFLEGLAILFLRAGQLSSYIQSFDKVVAYLT